MLLLLLIIFRFRTVFRDRWTITAAHLSCCLYIPDPLHHMIYIKHPPISHCDPVLGNIVSIISNTFLLSIHRHLSSDLINLGQILKILRIFVQPFQILDSLKLVDFLLLKDAIFTRLLGKLLYLILFFGFLEHCLVLQDELVFDWSKPRLQSIELSLKGCVFPVIHSIEMFSRRFRLLHISGEVDALVHVEGS